MKICRLYVFRNIHILENLKFFQNFLRQKLKMITFVNMKKEKLIADNKRLPIHDRIGVIEDILIDLEKEHLKLFSKFKISRIIRKRDSNQNNTTYTDLGEE